LAISLSLKPLARSLTMTSTCASVTFYFGLPTGIARTSRARSCRRRAAGRGRGNPGAFRAGTAGR
jgi:hypothetical protein